MWVKVPESIEFGVKRAVASIDRSVFLNLGLPTDWVRRFAEIQEFNEDLVRRALAIRYGDVSSWQLHVVRYSIERDSIEVLVSSPQFDDLPPGSAAPRL